MLSLLLLASPAIPDISGTGIFLSDQGTGFPTPVIMHDAPFEWSAPLPDRFFVGAGIQAGGRESFHCRGSGTTAGRSFFSAGYFSPDGWAYLAESGGLFRLTASGTGYATTDLVLLETVDDRLSAAFLSDTGGTAPVALWETPAVTAAAGFGGAGMGFAVELAPWLMLGPAVTGDGPWLKSSVRLGPLEVLSGPRTDRSGGVRRMARVSLTEEKWLLAASYNGDSVLFGGTALLASALTVSAVSSGPGISAALDLGSFSLSASTRAGEEWSAGGAFRLSTLTLSVFGLHSDGWEAGVGLEVGKGELPGQRSGLRPLR